MAKRKRKIVVEAISGDRSYGTWRIGDDVQGEWRRVRTYHERTEYESLIRGLKIRRIKPHNVRVRYFGFKLMTVPEFEQSQNLTYRDGSLTVFAEKRI